MIIRKLFRFEGSHIVRNCSSERCKKNYHGHSYVVEVLLYADSLDAGHMVYDFGLFKGTIKDVIDSFDHTHSMWNKEDKETQDFFHKHNERLVTMPVSPSAEGYSAMLAFVIGRILKNTEFNNQEGEILLHSVRVAETVTGWAEANEADAWSMFGRNFTLKDIVFSDQIKAEWQNPQMWDDLIAEKKFINPKIIPTH